MRCGARFRVLSAPALVFLLFPVLFGLWPNLVSAGQELWQLWSRDYVLIVTNATTPEEARALRDAVVQEGGQITVMLGSRLMIGKVPAEIRNVVRANGMVSALYAEPVQPDSIPQLSTTDHWFVEAFNQIRGSTGGQLTRSSTLPYEPAGTPGFSLGKGRSTGPQTSGSDARQRPDDIRLNSLAVSTTNDSMIGVVDVALLFVQSNGTSDPQLYVWTRSAEDTALAQIALDLAGWSHQAAAYEKQLTFRLVPVRHDEELVQQPYEPILHASDDDSLWIDAIMAKAGFSAGGYLQRVAAFNDSLRQNDGTDWAYTGLLIYNPPPAPAAFQDGTANYAYLGGPLVSVNYQSGFVRYLPNAVVPNIGGLFAHETGHIFWALDEYSWSSTGSGAAGVGPRPEIPNGNFQGDNPLSVPCVMRLDEITSMCSYTAAQVGWIQKPHFTTLTTEPAGLPIIIPGVGGEQFVGPVRLAWAYGQPVTIGARTVWPVNGESYTFAGWQDGEARPARMLIVSPNDTLLVAVYSATAEATPWTDYMAGSEGPAGDILWDVAFGPDSSLWTAGEGGISHFDGSTWEHFTPANGLPDDYVYKLAFGQDGALWAAGRAGVMYLDGGAWHVADTPPGWSSFNSLAFDRDGNLWVTALGYGVGRFDGSQWQTFTTTENLPSANVRSVVVDSSGGVWVASDAGISRFDGTGWSHFTTFEGMPIQDVSDLYVAPNGSVWAATSGLGLLEYDGSGWQQHLIPDLPNSEYVTAVAVDELGNVWFGYSNVFTWTPDGDSQLVQAGGLVKADSANWKRYGSDSGLAHNYIKRIRFDRRGNAYFATYGGGLSVLEGAVSPITPLPMGVTHENGPPQKFSLLQNYPNPFPQRAGRAVMAKPTTAIIYRLSQSAKVRLSIFDLLGREVAVLVDGEQSAGEHRAVWDASGVAGGVYFYRLEAGGRVETRRLLYLR